MNAKPSAVPESKEKPYKVKKAVPKPPRTCQEFLDYWNPRLPSISGDVELDFSFYAKGIIITDMRVPSALRTGTLYTEIEVADLIDQRPGDFEVRVREFLTKALRPSR